MEEEMPRNRFLSAGTSLFEVATGGAFVTGEHQVAIALAAVVTVVVSHITVLVDTLGSALIFPPPRIRSSATYKVIYQHE